MTSEKHEAILLKNGFTFRGVVVEEQDGKLILNDHKAGRVVISLDSISARWELKKWFP